jgi:hypothetical protein
MNRTVGALALGALLALIQPALLPERTALAQTAAKDVVELVDGTRVEGSFVEIKRGSYVVIELAGGAQQTIPWARVKNVIPGGTAAPVPAPPPAAGSIAPPPAATAAPAAGTGYVLLKDGTRVNGEVMEVMPGSYVSIKAADGTHMISWDNVQEVNNGPQAAPAPPPPPAAVTPPPQQTPAAAASPPASVPEHKEKSHGMSILVPIGFTVAGVGVLTGGVLGGLALSKMSDVKDQCPNKSCPPGNSAYGSANGLATGADVAFGIAAAGAVLGVIGLLVGEPAKEHPNEGATLWIGPGSLGVGGQF